MHYSEKVLSEKDFKSLLHATCMDMIRDEEKQINLLEKHKKWNSFPFEFYNFSFRESATTISTIKDFYRRVAGEDL
ncbi:MAG TPA: hypothetical protein VJ792_09970 [Candidatus Nitrosotalea sp.]|nr:hypothetical protein [Candidatus Nitrosotalea sp.]